MAQLSATMAQFVAADGGPSCEDLRLRRPDRGSQGQEAVFQRRSESMDAILNVQETQSDAPGYGWWCEGAGGGCKIGGAQPS
jgi:hypothetical protein